MRMPDADTDVVVVLYLLLPWMNGRGTTQFTYTCIPGYFGIWPRLLHD